MRGQQIGTTQELPIGVGGDGKSIRHVNSSRRKLAIEFPQRGILTTDDGNVLDPNLVKPADVARSGIAAEFMASSRGPQLLERLGQQLLDILGFALADMAREDF